MTKLKLFEVIVKASTEWTGTIEAMSFVDAKRIAEELFNEGQLRQCGEEVEAVFAWRQRTRTGSWTTFERRFLPIDGPDGALYWGRDQLPKDVDPHLVWTILYVSPGFCIVNRIDYVVCELPWTC